MTRHDNAAGFARYAERRLAHEDRPGWWVRFVDWWHGWRG